MVRAVYFDAVGTLIYLPQSVGHHYAEAGRFVGLELEAAALDRAFREVWKQMPARAANDGPRPDDDKGWWRELVHRVLAQVRPATEPLDADAFFEAAYAHFAEPGVWEVFPEVREVLASLHERELPFFVISNFDGRLRMVFEHLGLTPLFREIFLSSELGADKPDAAIFRRATKQSGFSPNESLYVGDEPERDWSGARAVGFQVFELDRPRNSLRDVLSILATPGELH